MEKKHGLLLLCLCTLLGCNGNTKTAREIAEENGTVLLMQARNAYNTGDYQTAVILIDSIRSTYPLAMEVREQGILLKDSVYLEEAREELRKGLDAGVDQQQLDEVQQKIKFYLRKLEHDKERRKSHAIHADEE